MDLNGIDSPDSQTPTADAPGRSGGPDGKFKPLSNQDLDYWRERCAETPMWKIANWSMPAATFCGLIATVDELRAELEEAQEAYLRLLSEVGGVWPG